MMQLYDEIKITSYISSELFQRLFCRKVSVGAICRQSLKTKLFHWVAAPYALFTRVAMIAESYFKDYLKEVHYALIL